MLHIVWKFIGCLLLLLYYTTIIIFIIYIVLELKHRHCRHKLIYDWSTFHYYVAYNIRGRFLVDSCWLLSVMPYFNWYFSHFHVLTVYWPDWTGIFPYHFVVIGYVYAFGLLVIKSSINVEMILQSHAGVKSETVQNLVLRQVSRAHVLFRLKYVI